MTPPADSFTGPSRNGASPESIDRRAFQLVVLGYITAVTMPPAGLIIGIVLARRRDTPRARHGWVIVAVSIVATIVWFIVFNSGIADTSSSDLM